MSITATFVGRAVVGNEVCTWGTYTDSGAATADNINTKIHSVTRMFLQPTGAAVATNAPVIVTTLPAAGSAISVRTDASQTGQWVAYGDAFN